MADFLMRMAERTLGLLPVVQPALSSKYAQELPGIAMRQEPTAIKSTPGLELEEEVVEDWEGTPQLPQALDHLPSIQRILPGKQATNVPRPLEPQAGYPPTPSAQRQQDELALPFRHAVHPVQGTSQESQSSSLMPQSLSASSESIPLGNSPVDAISKSVDPPVMQPSIARSSTRNPDTPSRRGASPGPAQPNPVQRERVQQTPHQNDAEATRLDTQFIGSPKEEDRPSYPDNIVGALGGESAMDNLVSSRSLSTHLQRKDFNAEPSTNISTTATTPSEAMSAPDSSSLVGKILPGGKEASKDVKLGTHLIVPSSSSPNAATQFPAPNRQQPGQSTPISTGRKPGERSTSDVRMPEPSDGDSQSIINAHPAPTQPAARNPGFASGLNAHWTQPLVSSSLSGNEGGQSIVPPSTLHYPAVSAFNATEHVKPMLPRSQPTLRSEQTELTQSEKRPAASVPQDNAIPTIRVTIGRIDVRAVPSTPPASSATTKSNRARPALSLNDYLKQRKGEQR